MKRATLPSLLALTLVAAAATGQSVGEKLEITREAVERQKRVIVAGSLPMTAAEEKAFWPLYDEYQEEQREITARADRVVAEYVEERDRLTDERARTMLDEMVKIDEDLAKLRRRYVDKMARALPARKLARYFQIENKLDAIVRADITRQIPLVP